jgi:TPR repeat protein
MNRKSAGASSPGSRSDALPAELLRPDALAPLPREASWWERIPLVPLALTLVLLAFVLVPPVKDNPRLVWSFAGVAGALFAWELILWGFARAKARVFRIEFVPIKSHWVQACVQFSIFLYWGWYWPNAYRALPQVAAQMIFVYTLDALLSWSRGRTWRVGFGPLPIVISTNLLLWFKDDWFYLQFLMLTAGVLGKQFITWEREGKRTHVFNPSAFGQSLFAIVLILTGTTKELTWGKEIAASFDPPHMLIVIFLGGLVVQYFFQVTLMTVAAAVTLVVASLAYTAATDGLYLFVNTNIAAPIFLGLHLLVTDPATSPRTNLGRVIFGVLYALGYIALFRLFDVLEVPLFWDKLLPVPVLNLCVPLIDRVVRSGALGRLNRAWESMLPARSMNLVHIGAWVVFFVSLILTGFIEGPHPGNSITFWKKAYVEGRHHAGNSLVMAAGSLAEGSGQGAAYNELGLICMEGEIVRENHGLAAQYFAKGCALRDESACVNVALQFLCLRERLSDADVALALDLLENDCNTDGKPRSCWLVGLAYETGRGRPFSPVRAIQCYEKCGPENLFAAKGLVRIALSGIGPKHDIHAAIPALITAAEKGDPESFWYLAYMYRDGVGLKKSEEKARGLLEKACKVGSERACEALKMPALPPYSDPVMSVPGWATAFPVE